MIFENGNCCICEFEPKWETTIDDEDAGIRLTITGKCRNNCNKNVSTSFNMGMGDRVFTRCSGFEEKTRQVIS